MIVSDLIWKFVLCCIWWMLLWNEWHIVLSELHTYYKYYSSDAICSWVPDGLITLRISISRMYFWWVATRGKINNSWCLNLYHCHSVLSTKEHVHRCADLLFLFGCMRRQCQSEWANFSIHSSWINFFYINLMAALRLTKRCQTEKWNELWAVSTCNNIIK